MSGAQSEDGSVQTSQEGQELDPRDSEAHRGVGFDEKLQTQESVKLAFVNCYFLSVQIKRLNFGKCAVYVAAVFGRVAFFFYYRP